VEGTTSSLMPTPAILGPVTVTPVGPVIETEYYIVGSLNGWNIGDLDNWKFYHSGKDVYDDPVFSILVENPGEFKIVPKSSKEAASWDYVFGSYDDTALEGELQADGGNLKVEVVLTAAKIVSFSIRSFVSTTGVLSPDPIANENPSTDC
jgi:hypothetical protein